jgi:hypothetical protein
MTLVSLLLVLVLVGVILYVVESVIPMDVRIKRIIEAVVLVGVLIYVLQAFGVLGGHTVDLR